MPGSSLAVGRGSVGAWLADRRCFPDQGSRAPRPVVDLEFRIRRSVARCRVCRGASGPVADLVLARTASAPPVGAAPSTCLHRDRSAHQVAAVQILRALRNVAADAGSTASGHFSWRTARLSLARWQLAAASGLTYSTELFHEHPRRMLGSVQPGRCIGEKPDVRHSTAETPTRFIRTGEGPPNALGGCAVSCAKLCGIALILPLPPSRPGQAYPL